MNKNKKIIIATVVLLAVGAAWFFTRRNRSINYMTASVTRGDIVTAVEATGAINPVTAVPVGAQVSGKIVRLFVDYNTLVKKGQIIAQIDPAGYETDVAQAQADVLNAQASLATAGANIESAKAGFSKAQAAVESAKAQFQKDKANFENAGKTYERNKTLLQKNYISKSDLDAALAAHEAASAQLSGDSALIESAKFEMNSARIQIGVALNQQAAAAAIEKNKKAALKKAETNLNYTRITSPVDGIVVSRNIDVGQTVVSSFQSPNLFVIAKDLKKMQVDTSVDEADIGKVRLGHPASFTVDAYPRDTFRGVVAQIRKNPINQQNVVNYDVIIYVSNDQLKLFPGMTADVRIQVGQRKDVLKIPNTALRFVPSGQQGEVQLSAHVQGRKEEKMVWLLKKGKAVPQQVQLGINNTSETEVTSGLSGGDFVIVGIKEKRARKNPFSIF